MTTPPLPDHVSIREVGPRDGFQNEPELISTNDKVRLIDQLARPGTGRLGVTSFVCPDITAQFADGSEVLRRIDPPESVSISVHIRNERGLAQALADRAEMDEISVCLTRSPTRAFSRPHIWCRAESWMPSEHVREWETLEPWRLTLLGSAAFPRG